MTWFYTEISIQEIAFENIICKMSTNFVQSSIRSGDIIISMEITYIDVLCKKMPLISPPVMLRSFGSHKKSINSLWLSDNIWRHNTGSTLAQVTVFCCLKLKIHPWINFDFLFVNVCGIHLRAISQWVPKVLFWMSLKILLLKLLV